MEKSSNANAAATNKKRKLSAIDEIRRKAMGRKMVAVYARARMELGCLEIGATTLALQLILVKRFKLYSFQLQGYKSPVLLFIVTTSPYRDWVQSDQGVARRTFENANRHEEHAAPNRKRSPITAAQGLHFRLCAQR